MRYTLTQIVDMKTKTTETFNTRVKAAKYCNVSARTIGNYIDTQRVLQERYVISTITKKKN